VQPRILGRFNVPELTETGSVALVAAGWPPSAGTVELAIEDDITLPLLVLWLAGARSPAVRRILRGMSSTGE
jgi:hypothetical protein